MDIQFAPYLFLALSLCFLWIDAMRKVWQIPYLIAVALGLSVGRLGILSLIPLLLFFLACYFSSHPKKVHLPRLLLDVVILIVGIMLAMRLFPGFKNWKIASAVTLSFDSTPYSFYLNFDKGSLGVFLLATIVPLCRKKSDWLTALKVFLLCGILAVLVLLILSWALGYVRLDPKIPSFTAMWLFHNLFFVAIAEEVFFRGFLLQRIADYLRGVKIGIIIALLISSIVFGLMHFYGGLCYVFLSTVAGIIYGLAYLWSGRIESAILVHFIVNAIHFFLFSYPALKI